MDILSEANNLRAIYQDMEAYLTLREEDQKFFDNLFVLLLVYDNNQFSNKYLAQRFNMPISTIEKRIKRLARANLIRRCVSCEYAEGKKHWTTTSRTLELDPTTFSFAKVKDQERRIMSARLEAANKDLDPMLEAYKQTQKKEQPAEPPPQTNYKVEVRFE